MACGNTWKSTELFERGETTSPVLPVLPLRWPDCPTCVEPLMRIEESQFWRCRPPPADDTF